MRTDDNLRSAILASMAEGNVRHVEDCAKDLDEYVGGITERYEVELAATRPPERSFEDDCEVCLQPAGVGSYSVTLQGDGPACHVLFCKECMLAVLNTMTERWRSAIEHNNKAVSELLQQLGLQDPFTRQSDD